MADFDRANVVAFIDSIRGAPDLDLVRIWVACAFRPEGPYQSDMGRVIDQFYELPIWEQQAVLYEMETFIRRAARNAAYSRSQVARKTNPL
jgi:hypothetical protein